MAQADQHDQPMSNGLQKKVNKWQPLDLAGVAPSNSGTCDKAAHELMLGWVMRT